MVLKVLVGLNFQERVMANEVPAFVVFYDPKVNKIVNQ